MSMVQIMDVYGDLISRLKDPDVSDFVIVRKDAFFIKNPVLIFNSWFKAGDFLFASDTEYNRVLERVECFFFVLVKSTGAVGSFHGSLYCFILFCFK